MIGDIHIRIIWCQKKDPYFILLSFRVKTKSTSTQCNGIFFMAVLIHINKLLLGIYILE